MQNVIGHQIRLFNDSSKKKIIIQICTLSLFSLVVSHIHKHTHSERELINGYINSKHNTYHFACFSCNLFQLYFQQVYLVNQVVDHCALQIVAGEAFVLCLFWNLIYCDCIEVQRFFFFFSSMNERRLWTFICLCFQHEVRCFSFLSLCFL